MKQSFHHALKISFRLLPLSTAVFLVGILFGCSGRAPRVEPPNVRPEKAAEKAITAYDKDGDGALSGDELAACPGMAGARQAYDQDGNGKISKEEIRARIESWYERGLGLTSLSCTVRYKGKPLAGAEVVLIPEPYLGSAVKPARGTTTDAGSGILAVSNSDLPDAHQGIKGVHYGTYKVEITHPEIAIPAKYNKDTMLGHEVAHDIGKPYATFNLQ